MLVVRGARLEQAVIKPWRYRCARLQRDELVCPPAGSSSLAQACSPSRDPEVQEKHSFFPGNCLCSRAVKASGAARSRAALRLRGERYRCRVVRVEVGVAGVLGEDVVMSLRQVSDKRGPAAGHAHGPQEG